MRTFMKQNFVRFAVLSNNKFGYETIYETEHFRGEYFVFVADKHRGRITEIGVGLGKNY